MNYIIQFFRILKSNFKAILLALFATLFFAFMIFPFDDLGDLVSTQVSSLTRGALYVRFERLKMSLFPQPGMQMQQVYVESAQTPGISAQEITITPSVEGLIQKMPFGYVSAKGLLKGNVDLHVSKGTRNENGLERVKIDLSAQKINLSDLRELANLPIMLKGKLDFQGSILTDMAMQEQPDMDVSMTIQQFEIPPSSVNTDMGPLTLPNLKLASIELKGRLAAGRFTIDSANIGKPTDELYGTIKGNMNITISNRGGAPSTQLGAYNLEFDLKAKRSFQDSATLFLTFIDGYKQNLPDGAQYKFKISSSSLNMPPNFSAAH